MLKLRGILCPLATPFDHRGDLYLAKIRHNTARLSRTRLSGFIVASRTGEGPLLSAEEKLRLWEAVRAEIDESRTLLAAAGAESVHETAALCERAAALRFDGVWIESPRAYGAETDLRRQGLYFRSVADRSPLPVAAALMAPVAGPALLAELASHPNIVAAACENLLGDALEQAVEAAGANLRLVAAGERGMAEALRRGVAAAVPPLANAVPFHLLSIEEAVRTREYDAAADLERRLDKAVEAAGRMGVAGLKYAADSRGYFGGAPRLPLEPLSQEDRETVEQALHGIAS